MRLCQELNFYSIYGIIILDFCTQELAYCAKKFEDDTCIIWGLQLCECHALLQQWLNKIHTKVVFWEYVLLRICEIMLN